MITLLLFAGPRDACGTASIGLPDDCAGKPISAAWGALCDRIPALAPWRSAVAFACNGQYCSPDHVVRDGDELAAIPPVSGG